MGTLAMPPDTRTMWGTLQGLEGAGSARYFGVFGKLLREPLGFDGRNRRQTGSDAVVNE